MKNTKKIIAMLLALVMIFTLAACGGQEKDGGKDGGKDNGGETTGAKKKVAVLLYDGQDPFIGTVREAIKNLADDTVEFDVHDGKNDSATQLDQLKNVIAQKVDGILVNIVDVTAAETFMTELENSKIPYLFFNRDMTASIKGTDKTIFVGTNAPEAGTMQGKMFLDYWKADTKKADRNGDGKVQYLMLHGGLDNPEAKARTEYSVKELTKEGLKVEELDMQVCDWKEDKAKQAADAWMQKFEKDVDVIFANNDGMALGAIKALNDVGYNKEKGSDKYIAIYGVDAIDTALAAVKSGSLTGTVKQDSEGMAKAVVSLIKNKMNGKDWLEGTEYKLFDDGKSVRIPYSEVK